MNRTAFVTGASRGIGRAIAAALAREGYAVGVNYLKEKEKAESLVSELRAEGLAAMAVQADVSDRAAIAAAIRAVEAELTGTRPRRQQFCSKKMLSGKRVSKTAQT